MVESTCNNSIVSINESNNCSSDIMGEPLELSDSIYIFVLPAIVLFGLIGNTVSLMIIYTTKLRTIPANQYLIVLTVSNSVFLLTLLCTLLKLDFVHVRICMIIEYLLATASYTSSWTITALTIERFLAIFYPLSRQNYGDMDRTSMLPLPWLFNLIMFGYLTEQEERPSGSRDVRQCLPRSGAWQVAIEVADLVLCYIIPCCIVVALNILVAKRLKTAALEQASFREGQHHSQQTSTTRGTDKRGRNREEQTTSAAQRTTYSRREFSGVLIVVPVVYLLLNTPFNMVTIASLCSAYGFNYTLFEIDDGSSHELLMFFYNGAHYLYYLNFATDFLVYAFSSRHFRRAAMTSWRRIFEPKWQQSRASISRAFTLLSVRRTNATLLPDSTRNERNTNVRELRVLRSADTVETSC
uniref:G-protein coupled receptors family 1 profile domain-containing protein n=1 Tax=Plectus sambesii TaxID=2011161 RepID=A0A914W4A1_9BILA